mmetsp:Transcript_21676/g.68002  ORF Transcript_21676/g.68002 Transcript_21676/m.68002 type:complete len:274 (-) Transcript_21676:549-1370(-)
MRLTYEAAFELHRTRRLRGGGPARIVNGAGGALPCHFVQRPFEDILVPYCSTGKDVLGPCAIHTIVTAFRESEGTLNATDLPLLYECVPHSDWRSEVELQDEAADQIPGVPGSIQLNLKGAANFMSPGLCRGPSCSGRRFGGATTVSRSFACPAPWITPDQHNKQLVFHCGRVLSPVAAAGGRHGSRGARWFEHFSLHFQGGECKTQMRPTLAAVERTRRYGQTLSCENATNRGMYEGCLWKGEPHAAASSLLMKCSDHVWHPRTLSLRGDPR